MACNHKRTRSKKGYGQPRNQLRRLTAKQFPDRRSLDADTRPGVPDPGPGVPTRRPRNPSARFLLTPNPDDLTRSTDFFRAPSPGAWTLISRFRPSPRDARRLTLTSSPPPGTHAQPPDSRPQAADSDLPLATPDSPIPTADHDPRPSTPRDLGSGSRTSGPTSKSGHPTPRPRPVRPALQLAAPDLDRPHSTASPLPRLWNLRRPSAIPRRHPDDPHVTPTTPRRHPDSPRGPPNPPTLLPPPAPPTSADPWTPKSLHPIPDPGPPAPTPRHPQPPDHWRRSITVTDILNHNHHHHHQDYN